MKTGIMIKRESAYTNNDGELVFPSENEKLLDNFLDKPKIIFIELFTKLATIKAKTLKELNILCWKKAEEINFFDFEVYVLPLK